MPLHINGINYKPYFIALMFQPKYFEIRLLYLDITIDYNSKYYGPALWFQVDGKNRFIYLRILGIEIINKSNNGTA